VARVLPHGESLEACRKAGIPADSVIAGRGPFSVEENREAIRRFSIGVLVTKDSGNAGGVREKLEAARLERCRVVIVRRPAGRSGQSGQQGYADINELVMALRSILSQ
jgi:precorrin-6A/cobalt-precorrin-6A reductase